MATQQSRGIARLMLLPSVAVLLVWMIVPLVYTLYLSFRIYVPTNPLRDGWAGFSNYTRFVGYFEFWSAFSVTLIMVLAVLAITIIVGVLLAVLLSQPMWGEGIIRLLVISPFFIMPAVAAKIWADLLMQVPNGLFANLSEMMGMAPIMFRSGDNTLWSIIGVISWQWLPFATLILLTAMQSLDSEQIEAAEMDGAPPLSRFIYITLPHLGRAITIVILIETIFLLAIFAEIQIMGEGQLGTKNLTYLIYDRVMNASDIGRGSAGGIIAVIVANMVAFVLMRVVGKNLDN